MEVYASFLLIPEKRVKRHLFLHTNLSMEKKRNFFFLLQLNCLRDMRSEKKNVYSIPHITTFWSESLVWERKFDEKSIYDAIWKSEMMMFIRRSLSIAFRRCCLLLLPHSSLFFSSLFTLRASFQSLFIYNRTQQQNNVKLNAWYPIQRIHVVSF